MTKLALPLGGLTGVPVVLNVFFSIHNTTNSTLVLNSLAQYYATKHVEPTVLLAVTPSMSITTIFRILSIAFYLVASSTLTAQTVGVLSGRILDRSSGQPLGYATISLYRSSDTTARPLRGTLSLNDGTFLLRNVPVGTYRLRVRLVGYAVAVKDSIHLHSADRLDLGSIFLEPEAIEGRAVEVSAERELMEIRLDRRVYQVGKDLTVAGGTAADALQNVPGITVDQDRTLQLRGSTNVTILLDGRPTTLTGGDRSGGTGLDNIPADAIEAIEVITTPDASYDADGGAGIVNIILKREHRQPLSAFISLTAGTRDKYTGFVAVGARTGNIRVDGSYSLSLQDYDFDRRITLVPGTPMASYPGNVSGDRPLRTLTHSPRVDLTAGIADGTLTAAIGAMLQTQRAGNQTDYTYYSRISRNGILQSIPIGVIEQRRGMQYDTTLGIEMALGYRRPLGNGWTLSADTRYLDNDTRTDYSGVMTKPNDGFFARNTSLWTTRTQLASAQVDLRYRMPNSMQVDVGIKASWRQLDAEQSATADTTDPLASMITFAAGATAVERISAAYAQATVPADAFQMSVGLRAEATEFDVYPRLSSDGATRQRYWNLFPNVSLVYAIDRLHRLSLRYGRRISRPQNEALLPIVRLDDPYNQRQGTPSLRPELVHSFEIGATLILPWATFAPMVYWRSSTDAIGRYRTFDPTTGITRMVFVNWDRVDAGGIELLAQLPIFSWWRSTLSGSIAYQRIIAGSIQAGLSNTGWNATLSWQNVFNLGNGWSGQISYNLRRIGPIAQGSIGTIRAGEIALRYEFLDGRAAAAFRVSDPLDERVFAISMRTPQFNQDLTFKRESRIAFLTLSYLFGSGQVPRDGSDTRPPADEM